MARTQQLFLPRRLSSVSILLTGSCSSGVNLIQYVILVDATTHCLSRHKQASQYRKENFAYILLSVQLTADEVNVLLLLPTYFRACCLLSDKCGDDSLYLSGDGVRLSSANQSRYTYRNSLQASH
eukprot:1925854-Pleurochrysis_carterae.AAC.1